MGLLLRPSIDFFFFFFSWNLFLFLSLRLSFGIRVQVPFSSSSPIYLYKFVFLQSRLPRKILFRGLWFSFATKIRKYLVGLISITLLRRKFRLYIQRFEVGVFAAMPKAFFDSIHFHFDWTTVLSLLAKRLYNNHFFKIAIFALRHCSAFSSGRNC